MTYGEWFTYRLYDGLIGLAFTVVAAAVLFGGKFVVDLVRRKR